MIVNKKLLFNLILTIALILILLSGAVIFGSRSIINQLFLEQSQQQLTIIGDLKKQELETFFNNLQQQVKLLSQDHVVRNAFQEFKLAFENMDIVKTYNHNQNEELKIVDEYNINNLNNFNNFNKLSYKNPNIIKYYNNLSKNFDEYFNDDHKFIDKPDFVNILSNLDPRTINLQVKYNNLGEESVTIAEYVNIHDKYHEYLSKIVTEYNYNDLLLLDLNGNVIYSVKKNIDFGASVTSASFITTELANLFNSIRYSTINEYNKITNFAEYFPDYYEPVCFVANKISNIGVLVFSIKLSMVDNLLQLSKYLNKVKIYLTDPDFRSMNVDNFGKIVNLYLLKANINNNLHSKSIDSMNTITIKEDKSPIISYLTKTKNNNLNLIIEAPKDILLDNLIKPLIKLFYVSCGVIILLLVLLYFIGSFNIEKTDSKLNRIKEFMKDIIIKQDFSSRISLNTEDIPGNIGDILNNMLAWFQKMLEPIVFKIKKFVVKYNEFLNSVTLVSNQLDKEQNFFSNAKEMISQLEVVIFKIQHECQQYYNIINEQKNAYINFNDLQHGQFNNKQNMIYLNGSLEYLLNMCNFTEMLCLQLNLEMSKSSKFKYKKSLSLFKQFKPMLGNLKSKLLQLKNSLNGYSMEYHSMCNSISDFFEKLKPINVNLNRLLEAQKSLLLISNDQLDNVNKLQKELLNLELKYNNFNKQLLEIVNNNPKLNVDIQINQGEASIQVVNSKT